MSVRRVLTAATIAALFPLAAKAEAITGCHCYRDRTFDPERPAAADEYILATTRSSLLSATFGTTKRELVQAVMTGTGTSPEDLWIAAWAAARTGRTDSALLEAKRTTRTWRAALKPSPSGSLGTAFEEALARGAPDSDLAALAVDDVLASRAGAAPSTLKGLRQAGAATGEVILSVVLAARVQTDPMTVLRAAKDGKATWGVVVQGFGLTPKDLDAVVRQAIQPR